LGPGAGCILDESSNSERIPACHRILPSKSPFRLTGRLWCRFKSGTGTICHSQLYIGLSRFNWKSACLPHCPCHPAYPLIPPTTAPPFPLSLFPPPNYQIRVGELSLPRGGSCSRTRIAPQACCDSQQICSPHHTCSWLVAFVCQRTVKNGHFLGVFG
jgi:hypothetical protein